AGFSRAWPVRLYKRLIRDRNFTRSVTKLRAKLNRHASSSAELAPGDPQSSNICALSRAVSFKRRAALHSEPTPESTGS
ncbi:hypothetical protein, partial [Pseudomonas syringae]|uniref:hypothetical protein n=1 Tax=Pseudomonas syringae TaxID=317 RepID=UPI001C07C215